MYPTPSRARVTMRKGCAMSRTSIPVKNLATRWMKDPEFRKAYDALDDEFALARALITARATRARPVRRAHLGDRGKADRPLHADRRCPADRPPGRTRSRDDQRHSRKWLWLGRCRPRGGPPRRRRAPHPGGMGRGVPDRHRDGDRLRSVRRFPERCDPRGDAHLGKPP